VTPRLSHVFKVIFILAMTILIFESLIPPLYASGPGYHDKLLHFCAYGVLMVLGAIAYPAVRLLILALMLFCLGGGIELAQSLMGQGRDGSWADQFANSCGIALPIILWIGFVRLRRV
jgi:hypothetical protein